MARQFTLMVGQVAWLAWSFLGLFILFNVLCMCGAPAIVNRFCSGPLGKLPGPSIAPAKHDNNVPNSWFCPGSFFFFFFMLTKHGIQVGLDSCFVFAFERCGVGFEVVEPLLVSSL